MSSYMYILFFLNYYHLIVLHCVNLQYAKRDINQTFKTKTKTKHANLTKTQCVLYCLKIIYAHIEHAKHVVLGCCLCVLSLLSLKSYGGSHSVSHCGSWWFVVVVVVVVVVVFFFIPVDF